MRPPTAGAVDLSRDAIAARRKAKAETQRDGGYNGSELIDVAARVFDEAKRLRKVGDRRAGRRAAAAYERADQALLTASVQIRLAQLTPLDRPYLHHLALDRIQKVKEEVQRAYHADAAVLAVDTHRRIQDQRNRRRAEGGR
jgi:hypothetical protein